MNVSVTKYFIPRQLARTSPLSSAFHKHFVLSSLKHFGFKQWRRAEHKVLNRPNKARAVTKPKDTMIPTRLLIISDTHGRLPSPADHDASTQVPFHGPLPSADVLIHCGDLTMNGRDEEHKAALQLITSIKADLKIVIPGNHDLTLDREYYAQYPKLHAPREEPYKPEALAKIRDMYTGPEARAAGVYFLVEGTAQFTLSNGARLGVYASAYTPEFCNWAYAYERTEDRYNPPPPSTGINKPGPENPIPSHGEVDIMITHGPPKGILDLNWRGDGPTENCGCDHLRKAVERCRPRVHAFGHIHEAWGAVLKSWEVDTMDVDDDNRENGEEALGAGDGNAYASTSTSTPPANTDHRKPLSPYHPRHNPSAYYMYASQSKQLHPSERLLSPGSYQEVQVPQMCAMVDARGLAFGKETLFVNASVMTLRYQTRNAPWCVDLLLPEAEGGKQGLEKRTGQE